MVDMKMPETIGTDLLLTDALIRIKSMEVLLIAKGIVTAEELNAEIRKFAEQIGKAMLQKANVTGDLDAIIKGISDRSKN